MTKASIDKLLAHLEVVLVELNKARKLSLEKTHAQKLEASSELASEVFDEVKFMGETIPF